MPSVTGSGAVSNVSTASAVIIYVFFFFKCICVVSTLQKAAHVVRPFWPLHDRLLGQFWVVSAETTRLKTRRKHSESPMATLIINDVSLKTPCDIKLGKNVASIKLMCPSIRPKPAESSWAFWNETWRKTLPNQRKRGFDTSATSSRHLKIAAKHTTSISLIFGFDF